MNQIIKTDSISPLETNKNPIQVADRLFQCMEFLAQKGPSGLTEVSNSLSLNKATTHRILNSLIYMGYAKQDPFTSKYSLTFKIWETANQMLSQINIVELARPYLKELMQKIEETIHLVQIENTHAVYIDKVEAYSNSVRLVSKVGKSIPLYCSGVGNALLADMSDESILSIWKNSTIKSYTSHTLTDFNAFLKKINQIRRDGYALDDEENELGVRCVAVSLKDYKGNARYALSISAPISRMNEDRIQELSQELLRTRNHIQQEWN